MSTANGFVNLNDSQYSTTGHIIGNIKHTAKGGQPIDGFVKGPQNPTSQYHKRTQKAQTLMRSGLKKPVQQFQTNLKRFTPATNIERENRAKQTPRHARVDRFGIPLPRTEISRPPSRPVTGELINNRQPGAKSAETTAAPLPSMIVSASHQKLERLLDEALTKADTHKQAMRYQAARHFWQRRWFSGHRRWFSLAAALALVITGLAFSWQKVPQLSVKVAGMKAHLTPAIPSFKPSGYAMAGPAQAVSGAVTIKYKLAGDQDRSYEISQAPSNLTSSLITKNIIPKGSTIQTSQVQGNTVYIYGPKNDAAWVNNGVLYTIKDRADLNSDQLINIVKGINP